MQANGAARGKTCTEFPCVTRNTTLRSRHFVGKEALLTLQASAGERLWGVSTYFAVDACGAKDILADGARVADGSSGCAESACIAIKALLPPSIRLKLARFT